MINALGDCKAHLASLVFPGFVSSIGETRLDDWNRYITGLSRRLEKLPIDPNKDRMHQMTIEKATAEWEKACAKYPKEGPSSAAGRALDDRGIACVVICAAIRNGIPHFGKTNFTFFG